jgi:hypothetical protein
MTNVTEENTRVTFSRKDNKRLQVLIIVIGKVGSGTGSTVTRIFAAKRNAYAALASNADRSGVKTYRHSLR